MTPHQQLLQMLTGYWVSQAIITAAKLGLADEIAKKPTTAEELGTAVGANADALHRLLRMLASVGIFAEQADGRFVLTPIAEPLRTGHPDSAHAFVLLLGDEHYQSWGLLDQAVRTGDCAFEMLYGQPVFDYLGKHPEKAKIFDAAMTGVHGRETAAMLDAYDFSGVKVLGRHWRRQRHRDQRSAPPQPTPEGDALRPPARRGTQPADGIWRESAFSRRSRRPA